MHSKCTQKQKRLPFLSSIKIATGHFDRENVFVRFVLQNVKIQNGNATKQRFVSKISVLYKKRVKKSYHFFLLFYFLKGIPKKSSKAKPS